jgi:IPT/TIG domain
MYRPEYGVVPHCKIGDKVTRAAFWSTVRIVCTAPPNDNINGLLKISVSLNGVDFVDSGFKFHYYE